MYDDKKDKILGIIIGLLFCVGIPVLLFVNATVGFALIIIIIVVLIIRAIIVRKTC